MSIVEHFRLGYYPITEEHKESLYTGISRNGPGSCKNTVVVILLPGNALMRRVDDGSLRIRKEKAASDYNLFKIYHYYGPNQRLTQQRLD